MNTRDDARYRLDLAEGYLTEAEEDFAADKWSGCLAAAQESVENAGKAIIACLAPVVKTHEPSRQLAALLDDPRLPAHLRIAA